MKQSRFYLAAILSFCIWGIMSLVVKPLQAYPSLDILFYRVFFSAAIMILISMLVRPKAFIVHKKLYAALPVKDKKGLIWQVVLGSILITGNWFFFIYVTNHISVRAASFSYLICPTITAVLAFFILREKLTVRQWIAILLSTVACIFLGLHTLKDVLYSLMIAFSYALYLVSQRKNYGIDKFLLLNFQVVLSALFLLPFYPVYSTALPTAPVFYVLLVIMALFFTILPLFLNLYALKGLRSSVVGVLLYITPMVGFALAMFRFHEKIDGWQFAAYGLVLFSVVLFNIKTQKKNGGN